MVGKSKLNSLSQNSHWGVSQSWKGTQKAWFVRRFFFFEAENFHQGEVPSKGPLDSPAICSAEQPSGERGPDGETGAQADNSLSM